MYSTGIKLVFTLLVVLVPVAVAYAYIQQNQSTVPGSLGVGKLPFASRTTHFA